uniref:Uncharacterized protein n=1 Tax=Mus musculus TaxID=10090 RepID=Q3UXH9_MOUSE|nr:unnamed protein product [Mus musculus]
MCGAEFPGLAAKVGIQWSGKTRTHTHSHSHTHTHTHTHPTLGTKGQGS